MFDHPWQEHYVNRLLKAAPKFAMGMRASADAQEMTAKINEFNNLLSMIASPCMTKTISWINISASIGRADFMP